MKDEYSVFDRSQQKTKNAAENIESDKSVSAPQFAPTAQLKVDHEDEEEIQMKNSTFQLKPEEEEEEVQLKKSTFQMKPEEEEEEVQLKEAPYQLKEESSKSSKTGTSTKTSLPMPVQQKMEGSLGADFSDVNVHANSSQAENLGAQAYAQGSDVHFAPGKYNPESQSGQELIGHELTHVVQQRQGRVQPTTQLKGVGVNNDNSLESEADTMGKKSATGAATGLGSSSSTSKSNTVQGSFLDDPWGTVSDAADSVIDAVGDVTNTRENEAALDAKEDANALAHDKRNFRSQNYGPITYTRPKITGSGFEASYFPNAKRLNAQVRAKVRYADGLVDNGGTVTSPNIFMNRGKLLTTLNLFPALKTQVLPYFQWGNEEKQINLIRFQENIRSTMNVWQNTGMSFQVDQTGWEDMTAVPNIDIQVAEGTAINKKENYGPFGMLTRQDEQGSDHLQLEIVKQMSAADAATVNTLVSTYINNLPLPGIIKNQLIPPAGDSRGVRSYLGNNDQSDADAGHNNFMSLESNRSDDPAAKTFNHVSEFDHDSSSLSPDEQLDLDTFLSDPKVLLRNPSGTVDIHLEGFASAKGSTKYNTELVERRLTTVSNALNAKIDSSNLNIRTHVIPANETNNSDRDAEDTLANDPANYKDEAYRAVDINIIQSGRGGQNVLSHEFGHIFGLGDEYAETTNGYSRPAGALADHDQLAKDAGVAGGAVVGNDQRMMSTGNNVQPAHYSTFADALRQLTGKPWKIIP